jgi:hypothetical protein
MESSFSVYMPEHVVFRKEFFGLIQRLYPHTIDLILSMYRGLGEFMGIWHKPRYGSAKLITKRFITKVMLLIPGLAKAGLLIQHTRA